MNKDRNFEKLIQNGIVPDLTVNDGMTPLSKAPKPASTIDPNKPVGRITPPDPWAIR